MPAPDVRASDAERNAVVERLRVASTEGRLAPEELDERIARALTARTHGELETLLADLPVAALPAAPAPDHDPDRSLAVRRRFASFVIPNFVCLAIWAATGAGSFWPIWVLLGTGIGFGAFLIRRLLGVQDDERHRRDRSAHGPRR